ncbi:MAG TPA: TlpA disulfide reductase family protein [Terriglobia bacterium]|nr:TlpA disulfide reductase family protein [Terriglobia bacterium]
MSEEFENQQSGAPPSEPDGAAGKGGIESSQPPLLPAEPRHGMSKGAKVAIGAVVAIVLAAALYFLNNRWIAPATAQQVRAAGNYPMAPDFSVTDLNGQKINLLDYRGKVVVLDFWATWCGPCRIEIPQFIEMQSKYRDQGLAIIGLATQDQLASVQEFYKQFHMDYTVAMSNDRTEALYGGILGLPTTFVIGRDGRIYSKHTGATSGGVFEREIKELLAASSSADSPDFKPAVPPNSVEDVDLGTPGEINHEVPGVDISKLTPVQLAAFKKQLQAKNCTCGGCKFNLLDCRKEDTTCPVSRKAAREELTKFQSGAGAKGDETKPAETKAEGSKT